MTRLLLLYRQEIILAVIWLVLAFLMICHSWHFFGWQYTIVSLVLSAGIIAGGKKIWEGEHGR